MYQSTLVVLPSFSVFFNNLIKVVYWGVKEFEPFSKKLANSFSRDYETIKFVPVPCPCSVQDTPSEWQFLSAVNYINTVTESADFGFIPLL